MPSKRDQLLPLYDGRPTHEAMLDRCKRDKVDPQTLRELIVESSSTTGHAHALHAYGVPTFVRKAARLENGTLGYQSVPAWIVYRTQRNGTISNGWGFPVQHTKILAVGEVPPMTPNAEGVAMAQANPKVPMLPAELERHYKELDAAAYFASAAEGEQADRANERQLLLEIALDASPLEGVLESDGSWKPAAKAGDAAARALALRTLLTICDARAAQWTPQSLARTIEKDSRDASGGSIRMFVVTHEGDSMAPAELRHLRMCDIAALCIVGDTEDGATFSSDPVDLTSPTALADLGRAVVSAQVRMAEHLQSLQPAEGDEGGEDSGQTAPRQRSA